MPIQRLEAQLTQKIAAGEVIERPASAVKELLENAIDAGSSRIDVELVEGGRSAIIVRDDGEGIAGNDLALAVERYATSKIRTEADLRSIKTLGFRGEALASIAAVSRMRIVSRSREGEAHALQIAGGEVVSLEPAGRGGGTTVEVRDLFYNMPARAEFLGTPRTEYLHASRMIQRTAILTPSIGWALRHDGRDVFHAPRTGDLLGRIGQVYGAEVARGMIPVSADRGGIEVRGFISRPDLKRGNRRDQLLVVNGRLVSDRGLSFVLSSAYRGILRPGSYPIAILFIELPRGEVDVNVHPRKEEVRFAEARQVQDTVASGLQAALSSRLVAPAMSHGGGAERPTQMSVAIGAGAPAPRPRSIAPETVPLDLSREVSLARGLRESEKVRIVGDRRVIGQLQATYLLVEAPEGLEIVDQHIAHERVLYEKLRAEFGAEGIVRQIFLLPARVEVPFELGEVLAARNDDLRRIGIVLEEFGGGTFLIREYPRALAEGQTRRGFQELIEALADVLDAGGDVREAVFDRMLAELACGAAIKAGEHVPLGEAQGLVERLMTLENPYLCPHGRPIIFPISREDLDRRFKRA